MGPRNVEITYTYTAAAFTFITTFTYTKRGSDRSGGPRGEKVAKNSLPKPNLNLGDNFWVIFRNQHFGFGRRIWRRQAPDGKHRVIQPARARCVRQVGPRL